MQRLKTVTLLDVSAVAGHHAMPAALLLGFTDFVNFCQVFAIRSFSQKLFGLDLGSCIHLDDCSPTLLSILSLDLLFTVH